MNCSSHRSIFREPLLNELRWHCCGVSLNPWGAVGALECDIDFASSDTHSAGWRGRVNSAYRRWRHPSPQWERSLEELSPNGLASRRRSLCAIVVAIFGVPFATRVLEGENPRQWRRARRVESHDQVLNHLAIAGHYPNYGESVTVTEPTTL